MNDIFHNLSSHIDIVGILFISLVIFLLTIMIRWQCNESVQFDIRDAFMKDGRVSKTALFEWIGVISLTFVLLHQEFKSELTDWYVAAYGMIVMAKGLTNIVKGLPTTKETPIQGEG